MQPCRLCSNPTEHRLTGEATLGDKKGSYDIHVCPGCWYLFEKQGIGREEVERTIRRQVEAAP